MYAKVQKEFVLIVGKNKDGKTKEDMVKRAFELGLLRNKELDVRVHILAKKD